MNRGFVLRNWLFFIYVEEMFGNTTKGFKGGKVFMWWILLFNSESFYEQQPMCKKMWKVYSVIQFFLMSIILNIVDIFFL